MKSVYKILTTLVRVFGGQPTPVPVPLQIEFNLPSRRKHPYSMCR
jgi:hypothetical protein